MNGIRKENDNVALFDLDGTLCDYDSAMLKSMNAIRAPSEPEIKHVPQDGIPPFMQARIDLICADELWWENMPPLAAGFDILMVARDLGYRPMILTQGPKRNPYAWSGKKRWVDRNIGVNVDITITRDKGLVYGKVMVDDYPKYILRWLQWRKNGLVIMPPNEGNKDFKHPQVIRYDCSEKLPEIHEAMKKRLSK